MTVLGRLGAYVGIDLMDDLVCTLENDFPVTVVRAVGHRTGSFSPTAVMLTVMPSPSCATTHSAIPRVSRFVFNQ